MIVQKGSTLKVMEEFNIQGKQTSFYKYCPGTFGYILVCAYVEQDRDVIDPSMAAWVHRTVFTSLHAVCLGASYVRECIKSY